MAKINYSDYKGDYWELALCKILIELNNTLSGISESLKIIIENGEIKDDTVREELQSPGKGR